MPVRPGIGADRPGADPGVPVHIPDRDLAACVLKKDVGTTAACPDGMPTRPGNGADRPTADPGIPVHFPDGDLARARVLPQDVGEAVLVEIARPDGFPSRPRIGGHGPAASPGGPVHLPDRGLTIGV